MRWIGGALAVAATGFAFSGGVQAQAVPAGPANVSTPAAARPFTDDGSQAAILSTYCVGCHSERMKSGGLVLQGVDVSNAEQHPETLEKVVRKMRAGLMPPSGAPRPDPQSYDRFRRSIESALDARAAKNPNAGRPEPLHRLNRTEYRNAIRDLLALDIDVADLIPADDSSYGFDNIAGILSTSPALLERYLAAARSISRLAVGGDLPAVDVKTYRMAPDAQQHTRVESLPFGTRGGALARHVFPQDGEYVIKVDLGGVGSVADVEQFEISLEGRRVKLFELRRQARGDNMYELTLGSGPKFEARLPVKAGTWEVGATFQRRPPDLIEQVREPFENPRVSGNDGGPGGSQPYVTLITITGPYTPSGPGDTPSRRRLFTCRPASAADESACARSIIEQLARRGFRGTGTPEDVRVLFDFYILARASGAPFEGGIETALRRVLADPLFLFRIEDSAIAAAGSGKARVPAAGGAVVPLSVVPFSDVELASRLSFFLWSSIPDDELLDVALRGQLRDRAVVARQVKRMLADPRSEALTTNFAAQWLLIRNVQMVRPGEPYLLAFDETLRQAFQRETELFVDSVVRENRSVMELLTARYTFVNERLARHYDLPHIKGTHFRRVELPADSPRGGLLGQGSILTLTSHAIRTSPVIRGKWILNNILGTPPPDPPANVPALVDKKTQAKVASVRERMSQHRANPVCAGCHNMIDPAGFALEGFDAIGRYRQVDESFNPIDASGVLPDGSKFNGIAEFRQQLALHPERFVNTVAERLLTYALGRGLEPYDMPAVRSIVRDVSRENNRFQSLVLAVVNSYPFMNRTVSMPEPTAARVQ